MFIEVGYGVATRYKKKVKSAEEAVEFAAEMLKPVWAWPTGKTHAQEDGREFLVLKGDEGSEPWAFLTRCKAKVVLWDEEYGAFGLCTDCAEPFMPSQIYPLHGWCEICEFCNDERRARVNADL